MKIIKILSISLLLISVNACQFKKSQTHNHLIGAWQVESVTWISEEKSAGIEQAQPGIFIFTENSYSIQWTPTQEARVPFNILSKPTDEEAIAGFKSVVFNAGNYSYTDSTIITKAFIAKVPGFEGGQIFYNYEIKDDQLTLTMIDEVYPDGSKPDWSGTWSTQFIMKRVSY